MTTATFADLAQQAEAEGFSNEILPIGEYDFEVAGTSAGKSQDNKDQIGVRFKVLAGPYAGKSAWLNLTLTVDNPKAVAVFLRQLTQLGVSMDFIKSQPLNEAGIAAIAAAIPVGAQFHATHGHRTFNQKVYADIKNIKAIGAPVAPAAPVVQSPVAAAVTAAAPTAAVVQGVSPAPTPAF